MHWNSVKLWTVDGTLIMLMTRELALVHSTTTDMFSLIEAILSTRRFLLNRLIRIWDANYARVCSHRIYAPISQGLVGER